MSVDILQWGALALLGASNLCYGVVLLMLIRDRRSA